MKEFSQEEMRDLKSDIKKSIKGREFIRLTSEKLEALLKHSSHLEYQVAKERRKIRDLEARIEDLAAI